MPILQRNTIRLGDDVFADIEEHPNTDVPQFYPRFTTTLGSNVLFLCDPYGENYKPTPEQKKILIEHIRTKGTWAYLRPRIGRERES